MDPPSEGTSEPTSHPVATQTAAAGPAQLDALPLPAALPGRRRGERVQFDDLPSDEQAFVRDRTIAAWTRDFSRKQVQEGWEKRGVVIPPDILED